MKKCIRMLTLVFLGLILFTSCGSETELSKIYSEIRDTDGITLSRDKKTLTIEYEKNPLSFVDEHDIIIIGIYEKLDIKSSELDNGNDEFGVETKRDGKKTTVIFTEK